MEYKISEHERIIMNEFWHSNQPLTSVDLFERLSDQFPHKTQIHRYLHQLEAKGLISVCGINSSDAKYAKYAREFKANITEEEFTKQVLFNDIGDTVTLNKIALSLLDAASPKNTSKQQRDEEEDRKLIEELERIIEEYKEENE